MITSKNIVLDDFSEYLTEQQYISLKLENLTGSYLVDTLILLKFVDVKIVQLILQENYEMDFVWLDSDTTPERLKKIANMYGIILKVHEFQDLDVYIPLGTNVDNASLQIDIPQYRFSYHYIADCNYRHLRENVKLTPLNFNLCDFRPLLLFRRLILDCLDCGGTDIHFVSTYEKKVPVHKIQYRIKRELVDSSFDIDYEVIQRVIQAVVSKLSTASASDLDSSQGVTTDIADLFGDGVCDLRMTGERVSAGMYIVVAIQTTTTTMLTISELGFPENDVFIIKDVAQRRTGLTLVTGEMRSGKNTTIFAMLNEICRLPIRIIEYSNPVENRMPFPQINYKGDIDVLKALLRLAKKEDLDIAVINEIPNSDVAFAVRDLVNSAIGVVTTTHIDRIWHVPNKLWEFFYNDYKSIISQLNAVINQKMFRKWKTAKLERHIFRPSDSGFDQFAWKWGLRQYYTPIEGYKVDFALQPLAEILVFTDDIKTKLLNLDEMWKAEQFLKNKVLEVNGTIEYKLCQYINKGICSLDELRKMY